MVRLGDFLGGLFAQIDRGRSQADLAGLALAQAYRDDPLLAELPVPRVTVEEVALDLKLAVSAVAPRRPTVTEAGRARVIERANDMWRDLSQTEPGLEQLVESGAWEDARRRGVERLPELLPVGVEIDPDAAATAASVVFSGELANALLEAPAERFDRLRRWPRPRIEELLQRRLSEALIEELRPPADPGAVDVLVTASELADVPPDRVTSMRVVLRESDRTWTSFETVDGDKRFKLVPE